MFIPETIQESVKLALNRLAELAYRLPQVPVSTDSMSTGTPPDASGDANVSTMDLSQTILCWGNTNLNPLYYKDVLRIAADTHRPVRFVRWLVYIYNVHTYIKLICDYYISIQDARVA